MTQSFEKFSLKVHPNIQQALDRGEMLLEWREAMQDITDLLAVMSRLSDPGPRFPAKLLDHKLIERTKRWTVNARFTGGTISVDVSFYGEDGTELPMYIRWSYWESERKAFVYKTPFFLGV